MILSLGHWEDREARGAWERSERADGEKVRDINEEMAVNGNSEDETYYWGLSHIQVLMATFDTVRTDQGHGHQSTNEQHAQYNS